MNLKLDSWGIVLAGHWNRMIFTPEWVGGKLFHQEEVETQIALMPVFPIIYRHDQVILEVAAGKLIFRPRFDTAFSLGEAQRMALTVLHDLPNTPLMGVGVNFSFVERDPPRPVLELFNLSDARAIARAGWDSPEVVVGRKLTGPPGTLQLSVCQGAEDVEIVLNFHADTPGPPEAACAAARQALDGRVVPLRDAALGFLRDIYGLRLDEE